MEMNVSLVLTTFKNKFDRVRRFLVMPLSFITFSCYSFNAICPLLKTFVEFLYNSFWIVKNAAERVKFCGEGMNLSFSYL